MRPVEGEVLPTHTIEVDVAQVVASAAATWTFFGGHIDADYARRQNRRHIYLATGPILGLVDSYVTRWAGWDAFLRKRKVAMRESICAGDVIELQGQVLGVDDAAGTVTVAVTVVNHMGGRCVEGELTLSLPEG